jgi:rod shape-determining protein MreC
MRNIFLFIARFSNLFFFLLLQAVALTMLFRYNKFHEAAYMNVANEASGKVFLRYNGIQTYFSLKKENEKLREQNARLMNLLKVDFSAPDSSVQLVIDTIRVDSIEQYRKFLFLPTKVIGNSVDAQNNYLTLHRGFNQGVNVNMAVVGPEGIIGKVINVSPNMSVVMSLLHRKNSVVAQLKKGSGFGEIIWDGKDPRFVTLTKIPRTIKISKGDTVVTSPYSDIFPGGQVVGFVEEVAEEKSTSVYSLKNLHKSEMDSLLSKVKKD